jgi:glutathione synthase/RimK-type ligase-like ATP-grasp enzyme
MSLGILYDSVEWSNHHLADIIRAAGIETELINLDKEPVCFERMGRHRLLVNRLFPSAFFRGHVRAFKVAGSVLHTLDDMGIPMVNPYPSFPYDWSKTCAGFALTKHGIPAPRCYAYFTEEEQLDKNSISYPCVLKPDCGGRSLYTYILDRRRDLERALGEIPKVPFIVQEHIEPTKKFTTRIEIVGDKVMSVMKRFVGETAISSYHAGSVFKDYQDCPEEVIDSAGRALRILHMDMGSLDIVETDGDKFYLIDINGTSNFSEDNIEMFGYDPMAPMAEYITTRYKRL